MSVILAMDEAPATEIQERLPGRVVLCRPDLSETHQDDWEADGPAQVVAMALRELPQVVVIDVTLGGSRYLASDAARVLLRLFDPPALVLVSPRESELLERWAGQAGVYKVISGRDAEDANLVAQTVAEARAWRAGRSPRALAPRLVRGAATQAQPRKRRVS